MKTSLYCAEPMIFYLARDQTYTMVPGLKITMHLPDTNCTRTHGIMRSTNPLPAVARGFADAYDTEDAST